MSELQTVLFADLLGFAALIEQYPDEILVETDGPLTSSGNSPSASMFARFHSVINQVLSGALREGRATVMIFSDCAFVVLPTPLLSAVTAAELMRSFIKSRVPVRMGMARGTFFTQRFSIDVRGTSQVQRAMFSGTGVVLANKAERSSGKGLRIFLYSSLQPSISSIQLRQRVLPIPTPVNNVSWELEYLHEREPPSFPPPTAEQKDQELISAVQAMMSEAPTAERIQYLETIAALERMRVAVGRQPFGLVQP